MNLFKHFAKAFVTALVVFTFFMSATAVTAYADTTSYHEHEHKNEETGLWEPDEGYVWDASLGKCVQINNSQSDQTVKSALNNLENGDSTFSELNNTLGKSLGSLYSMVMNVGIMLLFIAVLASIICFGVLKNEQAIQKNKAQIGRILLAVFGISIAATVFGLVAGIGSSVKAPGAVLPVLKLF